MRKRIITSLVMALLMLAFSAAPVLAYTYYADIIVQETAGTSYDMISCNATANIDYMAANGYFNSANGTDTRVLSGSTELPHLLATDNITFCTALSANTTLPLTFENGYTEQDFYNTFGYDGYITKTDAAGVEVGDNFTITQSAYINTNLITDTTQLTISSSWLSHVDGAPAPPHSGEINGWNPAQLVDDDTATAGFYTDNTTANATVDVDLQADYALVQWDYYTNPGAAAATWNIQYSSDNATWHTAYTGLDCSTGGGWHSATWTSVGAYQYWRSIKTNAPAGGDYHTELRVYYVPMRMLVHKGNALQSYLSPAVSGNITSVINSGNATVTATGISSGEHTIITGMTTPFTKMVVDGSLTLPVTDNLSYNGPLWQIECSSSPFTSIDSNAIASTVTGATWGTNGYTFDGVANNIALAAATGTTLDLLGEVTIEAWIYPTLIAGVDRTVVWRWVGYDLYIDNTNSKLKGQVYEPVGGYYTATGTTAISLDTWTHVAFTWDGNTLLVYVNGSDDTATPGTYNGVLNTSNNSVKIGTEAGAPFKGVIGWVIIRDKALTAGEILQDYNATLCHYDGSTDEDIYSMVGGVNDTADDWIFQDNTGSGFMPYAEYHKMYIGGNQVLWYQPENIINGTTLPDRSGNGNDGVITWGGPPSGVNVTIGSMVSVNQPGVQSIENLAPPELAPPVNQPDDYFQEDVGASLPLYEVVKFVADTSGTPIAIVWTVPFVFLGFLLFALIWLGTKHLAMAGIGPLLFFGLGVAMTVLPSWFIVVGVLWWIASISFELKGTI